MRGWVCLGAPIGGPDFVRQHAERIVLKAERQHAAIATLPSSHAAISLLRYTASFGLMNYEARNALVPTDVITRFDNSLGSTARRLLGVGDESTASFVVRAPFRYGGFGFRRGATVAPVALFAGALAALPLAAALTTVRLPADPILGRALALIAPPSVAAKAADLAINNPTKKKVQKLLTTMVEDADYEATLEDLPLRVKAALSSASAAHDWSNPSPNDFFKSFFSNAQVQVLARIRCGLPIATEPVPCTLCNGKRTADVMGDHSLVCKGQGVRTLLHNRLRDALFELASSGLTNAVREAHVFGDARRIDILIRDVQNEGRPTVVDVAVTHALQSDRTIAAAAGMPGGQASAYEAIKIGEYGELATEHRMHLVPFIVDSLGAFGSAGLPLLKRLAGAWGSRFNVDFAVAVKLATQRLSVVVMRSVADLALVNARAAG